MSSKVFITLICFSMMLLKVLYQNLKKMGGGALAAIVKYYLLLCNIICTFLCVKKLDTSVIVCKWSSITVNFPVRYSRIHQINVISGR